MVLSRSKLWLIERHNLLLNYNVLLKLVIDDVRGDLSDHLLQSDVALEGLVEVLLEDGLADRDASQVDRFELLVERHCLAESYQAALVGHLFVLRYVQESQAFVVGKLLGKDVEAAVVEDVA